MAYLERLKVQDIEQTVDLAERFNTVYGMMPKLKRQGVRAVLESSLLYENIYYAQVMKDGDKVVGAFVGMANESPFYEAVFATELGWYVEKPYRNSTSVAMLKEFENWAKHKAKANLVIMTYTTKMSDLDNLYSSLGYQRMEYNYTKWFT